MRKFIYIFCIFIVSCSPKREMIGEDKLKEFDGYYIYYRRGTIFINSYKNFNNQCSPMIVYYTSETLDSISNKLNIKKTICISDTIKIKSLAKKFLLLYPKYEVTNLSYDSNNSMSFGYSNPSSPEYVKFLNSNLKDKNVDIRNYKLIEDNWYKLKK